jgi:hypothetical protein
MTALLFYRRISAICVSHGWVPWVEIPPWHPRIMRYFAVDVPTRDAAVRSGVPADRVHVQPNFVNLKRFKTRPPLPAKPRRALVLSNYTHKHLPVIREACSAAGIEVDVRGRDAGNVAPCPEDILPQYDIVFAKGRSALEAVCVGNAVIICDRFGVGPMVSMKNALQLQTLSGDYQALYEPLSVQAVARELANYRPEDAAGVCLLARSVAGLDQAVITFLRAYEENIYKFAATPLDENAEAAAESSYLRWLAHHVKENPALFRKYDIQDAELQSASAHESRPAKPLRVPKVRQGFENIPLIGPLMNAIARCLQSKG